MELHHVDAFTDQPFKGNPAAVCVLTEAIPDSLQQSIAAEMNLSETAFVLPVENGFSLRWFTPKVEVDLCGHATLATAHVLWASGQVAGDESITFQTRSGPLHCSLRNGWIEMVFPSLPAQPCEAPDAVFEYLGIPPAPIFRSTIDYLIELPSAHALRAVSPDFARLATIDTRGFILTARSEDVQFDFYSRFFAPRVGINEDPVTGSAHCTLAPYWASKIGKSELTAKQLSDRTGVLKLLNRPTKTHLYGQAVTIFSTRISPSPAGRGPG